MTSINHHYPTLGDAGAPRSFLERRGYAQIRQDVNNLMAQAPSMGVAEIRQLIRDENASLQSRIQDYVEENASLQNLIREYAEENRDIQARLQVYKEDNQRLQQQLDKEKQTQDQRYRLLEAEFQSLK